MITYKSKKWWTDLILSSSSSAPYFTIEAMKDKELIFDSNEEQGFKKYASRDKYADFEVNISLAADIRFVFYDHGKIVKDVSFSFSFFFFFWPYPHHLFKRFRRLPRSSKRCFYFGSTPISSRTTISACPSPSSTRHARIRATSCTTRISE